MVILGGGAVSYERGTPVSLPSQLRSEAYYTSAEASAVRHDGDLRSKVVLRSKVDEVVAKPQGLLHERGTVGREGNDGELRSKVSPHQS